MRNLNLSWSYDLESCEAFDLTLLLEPVDARPGGFGGAVLRLDLGDLEDILLKEPLLEIWTYRSLLK